MQDHDTIAHRHCLYLVVGHVDRGRADPLLEKFEFLARRRAQLGIEIREWLIQQEDRRFAHNRPRQRHPLPLASRELPGLTVQELADTEQRSGPIDFLPVQFLLYFLSL